MGDSLDNPWRLIVRFFPFLISVFIGCSIIIHFLFKDGNRLCSFFILLLGISSIVVFLSSFSSVYFSYSVTRSIYFIFTGEFLCIACLVILNKREGIWKLLKVHCLASTMVAGYGIGENLSQFYFLSSYVFSGNSSRLLNFGGGDFEITHRAIGSIGNPNLLGFYLNLSIPFFFPFFLSCKNRYSKIFWRSGLFLSIILLVLTFSRGSWIAFFVSCVVLFWRNFRKLIFISFISFISLFLLTSVSGQIKNTYEEYFTNYQYNHRINSISIVAQVWATHPFFGTGVGEYRFFSKPLGSYNDNPDNMYLLMLSEIGSLGIIARFGFFAVLMNVLLKAVKFLGTKYGENGCDSAFFQTTLQRDYWFLRAFIACFAASFLNLVTTDGLQFPVTRMIFWIVAGLGITYAVIVIKENESLRYLVEKYRL